ncbi:MAG: complex I subunit 5 family protein [Hyphomonadaceae bacterium]
MSAAALLLLTLGLPLARAALAAIAPRPPGLRDVLNIGLALAHAAAAIMLVARVAQGESAEIVIARPLPDIAFAFALEPTGAVVAAAIAVLSAPHAIHMTGYLRATQDAAPARFMAFVSLSICMATGVAFAANLFTLFVFYQGLTLASLPLVAHTGDEAARNALRTYLSILLASAVGLLLPAMVWTHALAGDLNFRAGGVLAGHVGPGTANALLLLFVFGYAKTALPPLHRWLSATAQAPLPAIGAIAALSVIPAGAIALLKTVLYVFGPAMADARIASTALLALASFVTVAAALNALGKADVRARLIYALIAQSAAIVAGAMLATAPGTYSALLQIVAQSVAALTLTMSFGAVHAATGRLNVEEMDGLGRLMPWTFAGVAIGAVSLIGLPPLAGAWPKLWFMTASAESGVIWAGGLAAIAAIATFACLAPLAARAFVAAAPTDPFQRPDGASILLVAPIVFGAAMTLGLIATVDALYRFLTPIWLTPP